MILKYGNELISKFKKYDVKKVSDDKFILNLGQDNIDVHTVKYGNKIYVNIEGENYTFSEIDYNEAYIQAAKSDSNKDSIMSPMPGSVVKVLVRIGDEVKTGDGLIIVEAMKMESTLFSSIDGVVTEVNAEQGKQVDSDQILIVVEKKNG